MISRGEVLLLLFLWISLGPATAILKQVIYAGQSVARAGQESTTRRGMIDFRVGMWIIGFWITA